MTTDGETPAVQREEAARAKAHELLYEGPQLDRCGDDDEPGHLDTCCSVTDHILAEMERDAAASSRIAELERELDEAKAKNEHAYVAVRGVTRLRIRIADLIAERDAAILDANRLATLRFQLEEERDAALRDLAAEREARGRAEGALRRVEKHGHAEYQCSFVSGEWHCGKTCPAGIAGAYFAAQPSVPGDGEGGA